ncbi:MAG: bifunctional 4-hydroxy-2-oxoglutarate aldolase/2-dehydro-3-deoxy-phosphogluconate aldolase [Candidatus Ratteibacteria bacterium]|nr:bifunctional 4-hydroxy-2-oxoglutarate aldolase/2-dehydro-3-deoxy-phosphogluconate aldolase [Candidatus Ratteibacteria bacterium]
MNNVLKKIGDIGLVPVVVMDNADFAVPAAKALMDGGIKIMEITMRTEQGITAIKKVKEAYPDMLVGAGTVLSIEKAEKSVAAGAEFIVSPGLNIELVEWCQKKEVVITPGVITPTEVQQALKFGLTILKYFPANIFGGIKGCEALYGPYRMVKFIPTGGVNKENLADFANKSYIYAVGGGWLCKPEDINEKKFDKITQIAKESVDILLGFELAHIGINTKSEKESLAAAKVFSDAFGFSLKEGNSSNFSGEGIEVNKSKWYGTMGHIAIRTNSICRAVYYIEKKGYKIDWSTRKGTEQKPVAVYLKNEIGGFAVHLLQK